MTAAILGVHGIWNWAPTIPATAAATLSTNWRSAIEIDDLEMVYYSQHLQLNSQGIIDDLERLDRDRNGKVSEMLTSWIAASDNPPNDIAQGRAFAPVRQIASWFVSRYGVEYPLVNRFLAAFMSEVTLYFDPYQSYRRAAARLEVAAAVSAHRPRVVIAHSLGSVVTYEALAANPLLTVELLITVGSPLAMPDIVFDNLDPAPMGGRARKPRGVSRWINISDPSDLVALPRHLANRFDGVDDDQEVSAGVFFTHKADRYLQTRAVRQAVRRQLNQPRPTLH